MKLCEWLDPYLDQRLNGARRADFEAHLGECPACRQAVQEWPRIERALKIWVAHHSPPSCDLPDPEQRHRLLVAARAQKRAPAVRLHPIFIGVIAATVIVLIAGALVYVRWRGPTSHFTGRGKQSLREQPGTAEETLAVDYQDAEGQKSARLHLGQLLAVPRKTRLTARLRRAEMRLERNARLRLKKINKRVLRLALEQGAVACAVAPRRAEESFEIQAGAHLVRVVGTTFLVAFRPHRGLDVRVAEGTVEVRTEGQGPLRVHAGQFADFRPDGGRATGPFPYDPAQKPAGDLDRLLSSVNAPQPALTAPQPGPAASAARPRTAASPGIAPPQKDSAPQEEPLPRDKESRAGHTKGRARSKAPSSPQQETASDTPFPARNPEHWRQLILEEKLDQAAGQMHTYLRRAPDDLQIWSLFADCQRKRGQAKEAIHAYQQVIRIQPRGEAANRARYLAASILQDQFGQHQEAATLLEEILQAHPTEASMRAEVMLRLARARIALNQKTRAKDLLDTMIKDYQRTPAGMRARALLKSIQP